MLRTYITFLLLTFAPAIILAQDGAVNMPKARLGIVTMNFADGTPGHYTNAFPILKKYGLKGTFKVCVGKLGKGHMTGEQLVELYKAGQEIGDHTFLHQAEVWADPKHKDEWERQTAASLQIFRELGIQVKSWWMPGWSLGYGYYGKDLHDFVAKHYQYAFGYGGKDLEEPLGPNMHWNFYGDPYLIRCVGVGWKIGKEALGLKREESQEILKKAKMWVADSIQQGLLVTFGFHGVEERNDAIWGLEEFCKFVKQNNLSNMTFGEALEAFANPRKYYPEDIEQMPNPGFMYDLDENNRPDGYQKCSFASNDAKSPAGGRVAEIGNGTSTRIYGPEPGASKFSCWVRSADGVPRTVTPRIELTTIDEQFKYGKGQPIRTIPTLVRSEWKEISFTFAVENRTEWADIRWEVSPNGPIHLAAPSFKRAVQTGGYETINPGPHPRLFFTKEDIPSLRRKTEAPIAKEIWQSVKEVADHLLASRFLEPITGNREKSVPQARTQAGNARLLAFVYLMTGEDKYAARAKRETEAVLRAESWVDPHHKGDADLVSAWISFCLSLVYDWLYEYLTPEERSKLRAEVFKRGLEPIFRDSANGVWWSNWYRCNWGAVIHGQGGAAAMAYLSEDPRIPVWIQTAKEKICLHRQELCRDGGWGESVSYCCYAWNCANYFMTALKRLTNGRENLFHDDRIANAHLFPIHLLMPNGEEFVKFSNCGAGVRFTGEYLRQFAAEHKNPYAQWIAGRMVSNMPAVQLFGFLYCDPALEPKPPHDLPLAYHFRDIHWAVLRTAWENPDAILLAFKGGYNDWDHHHHDLNHFILYAYGSHIITDLGYPRAKWGCTTEAHNTIMVNGHEQLDGVNVAGGRGGADHYCTISEFVHSPTYDHLLGDATPAYDPKEVQSFTREVIFLRPEYFILFDRIAARKPSRFDWILHTYGDMVLKGNQITITQDEAAADVVLLHPANFLHEIHQKDWKEVGIHQPFKTAKADTFIKLRPPTDGEQAYFLSVIVPRRTHEGKNLTITPIAAHNLLGVKIESVGRTDVALFALTEPVIRYDILFAHARTCFVRHHGTQLTHFAIHQGKELKVGEHVLFHTDSLVESHSQKLP